MMCDVLGEEWHRSKGDTWGWNVEVEEILNKRDSQKAMCKVLLTMKTCIEAIPARQKNMVQ